MWQVSPPLFAVDCCLPILTPVSRPLSYLLWAWHIFFLICFGQWDKSNCGINRSILCHVTDLLFLPKYLVKYALLLMFWSGFFLANAISQVLLQSWHTGKNKSSAQEQGQMSRTCVILFYLHDSPIKELSPSPYQKRKWNFKM